MLAVSQMNNTTTKYVLLLFVIVCTFTITYILPLLINQYDYDSKELFPAGFDSASGWKHGGSVEVSKVPQTIVRLQSGSIENNEYVQYDINEQHVCNSKMMLSLFTRSENIRVGEKAWQAGRVVYVENTIRERRSRVLLLLTGTSNWTAHDLVVTPSDNVIQCGFKLQLLKSTGSMWAKDVSLKLIKENIYYEYGRASLLIVWGLVCLVILIRIVEMMRSEIRSILIFALLFLSGLFFLLMPGSLKHILEQLSERTPLSVVSLDSQSLFVHFLIFFVVSFFVVGKLRSLVRYEVPIFLLVMFAISTESIQLLIPGRGASLIDLSMDGVGIILAVMIVVLLTSVRKLSFIAK